MKSVPLLAALMLGAASLLPGAAIYSGGTYGENFDSLISTGNNQPWTDNTTLTGWYLDTVDRTSESITAGDGNDSNGDVYSFGYHPPTPGSSDRALGALPSGITGVLGAVNYALALRNSLGYALTDVTITYDGEQWHRGNNTPQFTDNVTFSYQVFAAGAGNITAASGWTTVSALTFSSPNVSDTQQEALDGNAAGNRTAGITATLNGVYWADGQEIWLRWTDMDEDSSNPRDHGLAIDNLQVSAIPEPASLVLVGLGLALGAARRRRTR